MMRENEFSPLGKSVTILGISGFVSIAIANIATGTVPHPYEFAVVLIGFGFFLVAKLSVAGRQGWLGFGPRLMSPGMANLCRAGYWMMAVGILATFTEWR